MLAAPILITGGLGFLGSNLSSRFSAAGEAVRILARPRREAQAAPDSPHEVVWGDIRDPEAVAEAVRGTEVVVHLVSNFRKGGSDEREAYAVNVEGTRNVLAACARFGVRQLIHCSTIGVHGSIREVPGNEQTELRPLDLYQETKRQAEEEVWRFAETGAVPVTVIRPISVYGPGDLRFLKLFRMIKQRRFVMIGTGEVMFHPAYIDNVVDGFALCLRNEKAYGEVFILADEEYVPLRVLVERIAGELGVPVPRLRVPAAPVRALAALCERVCVPLGLEPPLHRRRVSFFESNRGFSIAKAKRILGYRPRLDLDGGLRRTIDWYERQGLL